MARIAILTEGFTEPHHGKTAASILRYRGDEVVALIDSQCAGRTAGEMLGVGGSIPIHADLSAFRADRADGADDAEGRDEAPESLDADELMIGVAPTGLVFPAQWRVLILDAIERGWNVTNGTHTFLTEDAEIVERAAARGVRLWDVRTPPPGIGCSEDVARHAKSLRVHTVGTDCAVGKMTVSIELDRALRERGHDSRFIATGQTGILVSGYGLPIDRIISDFIAGAAERLVMENSEREILSIEGQGSIYHPKYSGVTLGLMHGCAPDLLILCDQSATSEISSDTGRPKPTLAEALDLYTRSANIIHPCRIVAIALNTHGLDDSEARRAVEEAEAETALPATDVIRFGVEKLADAVLAAHKRTSS